MNDGSLKSVQRAAYEARSAWRRAQAVDTTAAGLVLGLIAASLHAAVLEFVAPEGLGLTHLPLLALWAVPAVLAGLVRWSLAPTTTAAAAELDSRLALDDRIGTALEFAGNDARLVHAQLADATTHADAAQPGAVFRPAWNRIGPGLLVGLLLLLLVTGAGLTFQWTPPAPPTAMEQSAGDLLAAIDRDRTERIELGDREAVRLLNDLERRIKRITAREAKIRKALAKRPTPPPAQTNDEPELEPPVVPEKVPDGITVEDLDALEAATLAELALTDVMEAEIISELFHDTDVAQRLIEEFGEHDHQEMEATANSATASQFGEQTAADRAVDRAVNEDMLSSTGIDPDSLNSTEDRIQENMSMIRRDLSAESMAAHDKGHDTQESFNRFLKDFVKELQATVAEKALGKKRKKDGDRTVKTSAGKAMADKRDDMSKSGFEEMDGPKRQSAEAPSEPAGTTTPGTGKPPKDMKLKQGKGKGENAVAMKGKGDGTTSAGATGAGTGTQSGDGLRARIPPPSGEGPLEEVLGTLAQGRMPPEERDQMFQRMARHKVQAGLTSEGDDVMFDYFAEAEALIVDHGDYLPPLFRDYAHSYFEAIRPGAGNND